MTFNDPFSLLGISKRYRIALPALEQRHRDLSRTLHPDRFAQAPAAERRAAIERASAVNEAFRQLRNPLTRATALLASEGRDVTDASRASQAFLMEMLELRESLEEAKSLADAERRTQHVTHLRDTVEARLSAAEETLTNVFDTRANDRDPIDSAALDRAYEALVSLRYFYRFLDEAESVLAGDDL